MNDAASFDAILQCNLLEVFCEALGAAIFVTDKLDEISFASIRLLHLFPIRESAIAPGGRARDLYGALHDAGCRFGNGEHPAVGGREDWIAERIACAWKERVDKIEQVGPDRWMRIVSRRFSSGLGFVVIQDVSEQKKKENLLRIEQERVKLTEEILDTLPVAVAVKDRNLDYVAVNQEFCRLIGRSQDALLGNGSWDALTPDLAGRIEQMDWQLLSSGEPALAHITHTRPDGTTVPLRRRAHRLGRPGSHFIAVSLTEESGSDEGRGAAAEPIGTHDAASHLHGAGAGPLRNVLILGEGRNHGHGLKLALRAHGIDLCHVRDVLEFAALLPAARAAGLAIDLAMIEFDFDPAAFNVAAAAGLDFRMLPRDADDSAVLAEILGALARSAPSRSDPPPAEDTVQPGRMARPADRRETAGMAEERVAALDVLAVEDNPINRMVLEQMLGSLSLTFRIVATAAEGLVECAAHAPRFVLADTTLPDMEVADFALGLRRIDPARPLVALIPSDSEDLHRQARIAGFDHSLSKPLSAEALGLIAAELVSGRPDISRTPDNPAA